jgi:hypothetical protein
MELYIILRSEIDCAAKCMNVKGCSAFRQIDESQTCQLGRLTGLNETRETDLNGIKVHISEAAKGMKKS